MKLTRAMIMEARTPRGAWNKPQLKMIGVDWPPMRGWIDRAEGSDISEDDYERFMALSTAKWKRPKIQLHSCPFCNSTTPFELTGLKEHLEDHCIHYRITIKPNQSIEF